MTIIALTGLAGSGKDSVADILVAQAHFTKAAFADALRAELAHAFGCSVDLFTDRATKEIPTKALSLDKCSDNRFVHMFIKEESAPDAPAINDVTAILTRPRSPRRMMQLWGTEYRRKLFDVDYWIIELSDRMQAIAGPVVISDCREIHEADFISQQSGEIWRVNRNNITPVFAHSSEAQIPDYYIDREIDNNADLNLLQVETHLALATAIRTAQGGLAA